MNTSGENVEDAKVDPLVEHGEKAGVLVQVRDPHGFASKSEEWHQDFRKRLLRKVDSHLLPMLCLMFLMSYLDRSNLAQARLAGLESDLGLVGAEFNTCTSILFVGYLLMQLPSNLILTRVKPRIYLPCTMLIWGGLSTAQAGVKSFGGLFACRLLLGFAEAPYFPGAVYLMSTWYTREELSKRYALFYLGPALANMFGGLIAAGVLQGLDGHGGLRAWRWLYVVEGVCTVGLSLVSFFVLPNFPHTTSWLSDEERAYAVWRIAKDIGDLDCAEDEPSMVQSAWLAIKDYRTWMFVAIQHCILLAQTVTFFFPSIVSTLGYDNYTSKWPRRLGKASTSLDSLYYILAQITHAFSALLLTCPVWVATFIACLFTSFSTSRLKERTMHIVVPMAFTIVGYIMCITITVRGARFFAMFLMAMGAQCCFMVVLTWISNSFPRPLGKRAAVIAIVNMVGNASNIYGSYLYPSSSAPMYVFGGATVAGLGCVCIIMSVAMRFILMRENKRIQAVGQRVGIDPQRSEKAYEGDQLRMYLYERGFKYVY